MKLYISIPISGRPLHEAKYHAECIKATLTPHGHECITPFDVCPEPGKTYGHYMGRDIEAILDNNIDGIVFATASTTPTAVCWSTPPRRYTPRA